MYWTNFWRPTINVDQIIKKTLTVVCSPYLYASFDTFCAQIGQLFEAQWVFEVCLEIDKSLLSKEKVLDLGILPNVQSLTVPRLIDQFGRKMCQKNRKDVDHKVLKEFFQKSFFVHEQSAAKNLFITYVGYDPDGLFWLQL